MNKRVKIPIRFKDNILGRFNPDNAELVDGDMYCINERCELCKRYMYNGGGLCSDCPITLPDHIGATACVELMERILGENVFDFLDVSPGEVSWWLDDNTEAVSALREGLTVVDDCIEWVK